jgi:hypothetical protein
MAKKPVKKSSAKKSKSKTSGKMRDLPAKALGADKAGSVKGGIIVQSQFLKDATSLKIDGLNTLKINTSTNYLK